MFERSITIKHYMKLEQLSHVTYEYFDVKQREWVSKPFSEYIKHHHFRRGSTSNKSEAQEQTVVFYGRLYRVKHK